MAKYVVIAILTLFDFTFAQRASTDSSFIDKINLIAEAEYQIGQVHMYNKVLDNKPYIQMPVSGQLDFNLGHVIGAGIGLQYANWKILASLTLNYQRNNPTASFKLNNGKTIGKEVKSQFLLLNLYFQYYFNDNLGLGLRYKRNAVSYSPSFKKEYPSLLHINLFYDMVYLYMPYKFKWKKFRFSGQIGFPVYSQIRSMDYFAAFLNFKDPKSPDIPSTAGHATIVIKNRPYALYWNFGILLFSKIKFLYQFEYSWSKSYYTQYRNALILKFALPSF